MSTVDSVQPRLVPMVLFSFSTAHLNQKDKVRFFYALNGRDTKSGVTEKYGLTHLGPSLILVSQAFEHVVNEFFTYWGCTHHRAHLWMESDLK